MSAEIKCPNCGHQFEPTDLIREEIQREANAKAEEWKKKKEKDFADEKQKLQQQLEEAIRKSVSEDYETRFRLLDQSNKENEEKLRLARQQQLEFLKKERELKTKEAELELAVQKKLQEERDKLTAEIRKLEEQRIATKETEYQLRLKEM